MSEFTDPSPNPNPGEGKNRIINADEQQIFIDKINDLEPLLDEEKEIDPYQQILGVKAVATIVDMESAETPEEEEEFFSANSSLRAWFRVPDGKIALVERQRSKTYMDGKLLNDINWWSVHVTSFPEPVNDIKIKAIESFEIEDLNGSFVPQCSEALFTRGADDTKWVYQPCMKSVFFRERRVADEGSRRMGLFIPAKNPLLAAIGMSRETEEMFNRLRQETEQLEDATGEQGERFTITTLENVMGVLVQCNASTKITT